jgi:signal transduction histidine kinase
MLKSQSPHALVSFSVLVCLVVVLVCVYLALHLPWLGITIQYHEPTEQWQVAAIHPDSINRKTFEDHLQKNNLQLPLAIAFIQAGDQTISLSQNLFMEEPDTLPTYAQFNSLMQDQQQLFVASENKNLYLITDTGDSISLQTSKRPISNLPGLFWFQLLVGVGGALTGALVWASRQRDLAAILYGLTGVGYLIFAPAAAIYSSREFIINGELFRALSAINHFGALFYTASLTSLLWTYPIKLGSSKIPLLIYLSAFAAWIVNLFQWAAPALMHLSVLGIFSVSFIFAVVQWQKTRVDPRGRAALRWFLLSIYTATGLFAGFIIIPAALHIQQPAPQGLMFGAFLVMYWGLALGIVKYRLFQLESWWYSITGWFVSGLFIIAFDVILVSGLALPQDIALPLALAIAGWIYFPLRQLVWKRIGKQKTHVLSDWIGNVLPLLIDKQMDETFKTASERWADILAEVWQTPYVAVCEGQLDKPLITNEGLRLRVPAYPAEQAHHFNVDLPDAGARLFTTADLETVKHLQQIVGLALERIDARNQGMQLERDRIRRDMHDDLGASLLSLLHASAPETKPLVKNAIAEMRGLVSTLEQAPITKQTAIANWRHEIEERCQLANAKLEWRDNEEALPDLLSARRYSNLSRILREAVSNALKYASPRELDVCISGSSISVSNPMAPGEISSAGKGQRIMQERASEINVSLSHSFSNSCCLLRISIPPEQG